MPLLALIVVSCTDKCKNDAHVIEIDFGSPVESVSLLSFIDTLISVRLELPEPLFFGVTSEVLFADTNIYVVDRKQSKIFRFNKDGQFLNTIGNKGDAPGEFVSIKSCFLGRDTLFINDLGARRIFSYTPNGKFISVVPFSFSLVYDNIMYLSDGKFLCHRIGPSKNNRGIWIMNEKGEKTEVLFANKDVYPYCNSDWGTLTMIDDGLIGIYEPPTGTYYTFDINKHILKKIYRQKSTAKMLGDFKGVDQILDVKEDYDYCIITLNANNYIFSLWALANHTGLFSLYSKKTQKITVFKKPLIDFLGHSSLGTPMSSNLPNTLVTILTDEYLFDACPEQYKTMKFNEQVMIVNKWVFK